MTAVPVQTTGAFTRGTPTRLFTTRYVSLATVAPYDVSRDGKRFLMIKEMSGSDPTSAAPASISVVLNWMEELKQARAHALTSTRETG